MMNLILTGIVFAGPLYIIIRFMIEYSHATGTTWERFRSAAVSSWTIMWTRLNAMSVTLIGAVGEVSTWAGAPGIKDAIEPWMAPKYMLGYILFVLIGAEIARRRAL